MKTTQEIFDEVIAAMQAQGRPSIAGTYCLYRSPNGLKCAVGCLIPDDVYQEKWDVGARTVRQLLATDEDFRKWFERDIAPLPGGQFNLLDPGNEQLSLLTDLQRWHDYCSTERVFDTLNGHCELEKIVQRFRLKYDGWKSAARTRG